MFHHVHHPGQVGAWVQQAQGGFQGIGVRALLDHRSAFAVVLTHHDQRAAHHAGGGQIGQGVGGHVGADDGLPGDSPAQGVVDGRAQHGGGRGFIGAGLHVHAQFAQVILGLHHHVQQVRHGRALVAADVRHARLQQGLGDGQDALAMEGLTRSQAQGFYFPAE